ncbi:hypothetical protein [Thorsellia anophelis]|uniref:Uncharacterized protein n=1 Tax=Thorsellia anophelis DSM 18579 TaxID=1123402 RepID=A0A1I0ED11_9GAMM|nr:hypothetical protein [Thorsellia anophelis]SET42826.1 hypothetical protein SAMN02583745_02325 [Thorsellia anophelis DSM 18579]
MSLKKITFLILFFLMPHTWAEESFWRFEKMIKTADISNEYIDIEPIMDFFIQHPLRITPEQIFINEQCFYHYGTKMKYFTQLSTDELVQEKRYSDEYYTKWIQNFEHFNLNVENGVPVVFADWNNTTCPTSLLKPLSFFYHFENKLIFSYDAYKVSYVQSSEAPTQVFDKKIEVLPHQYPYLCYFNLYREMTRSACKELQLTPKLVRTLYIPKDEQIYSVFNLPEQENNPIEKYEIIFEKKYSQFKNIFELIPGNKSLDFFIEDEKFTAVALSQDNTILDKWQFDGENIYVNDELMTHPAGKKVTQISINFSQNEDAISCINTPFDIESYSWSRTCRYRQDFMQSYNLFVKRNSKSETPVNFLKQLTQGKDEEIPCTESGCISIDYKWINKAHLMIRVSWDGGIDTYEFIEKNGETSIKEINYPD